MWKMGACSRKLMGVADKNGRGRTILFPHTSFQFNKSLPQDSLMHVTVYALLSDGYSKVFKGK